MIGRTLSHYRISARLGAGGMGEVYRAEDSELRREVALKLLPESVSSDPLRLSRFKREARSLASLDHPNIVTVFSIEQDQGLHFLTMELIEGETLAEVIPDDGLTIDRFFELAIPLVDAVSSAHAHGIIHRDLKPTNVMVGKDGRIRVLDFGLAKLTLGDEQNLESSITTEALTGVNHVVGTLAYMSPEQIQGKRVDARSDIFSLGVLLYQMATGQKPFVGGSSVELMYSVLKDNPPSVTHVRSTLPPHLARIVGHCLEKDQEERLQSAKDLRYELEELREELSAGEAVASAEQIGAPSPVPPEAPTTGRGRAWSLAALGVVVVAAIAAVVGMIAQRSGDTPPPPVHLAVVEHQLFAGEPESGYPRQAFVQVLRERLSRLKGVFLIQECDGLEPSPSAQGPEPDLTLQADVRKIGDAITVNIRLVDRREETYLDQAVLGGSSLEPYSLLDRVGESVAQMLRSQLGVPARFLAGPAASRDQEAVELYLRARTTLRGLDGPPEDVETTLELLGRSLDRDPRFVEARTLQGRALFKMYRTTGDDGWLARAKASCEEAMDLKPGWAPAHCCQGHVLRALDRPLEAVSEYIEAIELDGSLVAAYTGLRGAFWDLGLPATAEKTWQRVVELHPDFWDSHYQLGGYYMETQRYEEAIEAYQRALELTPVNFTVYYSMGGSQYYLGRYGEAMDSYERSLRIRPDYRAYSNLAHTYYLMRRYEDAVQAFERALELEDGSYIVWGNLGKALHFAGRGEEAAAAFGRAVELCEDRLGANPGDTIALIQMAHYQAMSGDGEAGVASLDKALSVRADDAHDYFTAAMIHAHLGDRAVALDWLERAVAGGYSQTEIKTTPELDDLRGERRYGELFRLSSRPAKAEPASRRD